MPRIEELLTPRELIDYTKTRTQEAYMGEYLFPEEGSIRNRYGKGCQQPVGIGQGTCV